MSYCSHIIEKRENHFKSSIVLKSKSNNSSVIENVKNTEESKEEKILITFIKYTNLFILSSSEDINFHVNTHVYSTQVLNKSQQIYLWIDLVLLLFLLNKHLLKKKLMGT